MHHGHHDIESVVEILEEVGENKHLDDQRQSAALVSWNQMIGRIVFIFAMELPMNSSTKEVYVHYIFYFLFIIGISYGVKTWLELKATYFYHTVGHRLHAVALRIASLIFDFFVLGFFSLLRLRGEYTLADIPFVVMLLTIVDLLVNTYIRHAEHKRFGYFSR